MLIHCIVSVCTALGCPDIPAPRHGWVQRLSQEEAVVGCNDTMETYHVQCDGSTWKGHWKNCTDVDGLCSFIQIISTHDIIIYEISISRGFGSLNHIFILLTSGTSLMSCPLETYTYFNVVGAVAAGAIQSGWTLFSQSHGKLHVMLMFAQY